MVFPTTLGLGRDTRATSYMPLPLGRHTRQRNTPLLHTCLTHTGFSCLSLVAYPRVALAAPCALHYPFFTSCYITRATYPATYLLQTPVPRVSLGRTFVDAPIYVYELRFAPPPAAIQSRLEDDRVAMAEPAGAQPPSLCRFAASCPGGRTRRCRAWAPRACRRHAVSQGPAWGRGVVGIAALRVYGGNRGMRCVLELCRRASVL
jgi:hypothetical protein